jgi:repressor LexA
VLPLTKRQREILDYLNEFIQRHGYAPSLEEIGRQFNLSSLATVHKHLTNLQEKGFIRRAWNRSRSVELVPARVGGRAIELPMLGFVAAGVPIEAVPGSETIAVPESMAGKRDSYVLRCGAISMIDEQIATATSSSSRIASRPTTARWSSPWSAGQDVTLEEVLSRQRQDPPAAANPAMQPMCFDPDNRPGARRRQSA